MVERQVIEIITKDYPKDYKILGNEHLYIDLAIDSLGFLSLILEIEKIFNISFHIAEFEQCLYLNQLINLVIKKVDERGE